VNKRSRRFGRDRLTRRSLNPATLIALNRPHEVNVHIRGAPNNGLTKDENKLYLQAAIYCVVPAAIEVLAIARKAFKEINIQIDNCRWNLNHPAFKRQAMTLTTLAPGITSNE